VSERFPVRRIAVIAAVLTWLGPFSMDAYSPGFPAIGEEFGVSHSGVQFTLTATLVGLVLGQITGGLVVDRYGRRRPLLISLVVFVLASLACALAPNLGLLVLARFLQGASAAIGVATSRTLGRDVLEGHQLAVFYSQLTAVQSVAPEIGPLAGSALMGVGGSWRFIFAMITGLGVLALLLVVFRLPETAPDRQPDSPRIPGPRAPVESRGGMLHLLRQRRMALSFVLMLLTTGTILTYLASTSFLLQDRYGLSPQGYGVVFAVNAVGLLIAGQTNARLVRRFRPGAIATVGFAALALVGAGLLAAFALGAPVPVVLALLFAMLTCCGFITPNVVTIGMTVPRERAGAASALLGIAQYALGAVGAPIVGIGADWDVPIAAYLICGYPLLGLLVITTLGRRSYRDAVKPPKPLNVPIEKVTT
jgi:MFS transporter, DHA1 family, multidrug resistance protein